jgi:hypothetical protein
MNFSNIARQLSEDISMDVAANSSEKAKAGGEIQTNKTNDRKNRQKAQMSSQNTTPQKSDVSYASEEARLEREELKMMEDAKSDWRKDLSEAMKPEEVNHPYVDVMPSVNQKANEMKKQMKGAGKATEMEGGKQAKMAEEMSIKDQMAMAADAGKKRNPNPDHKAIRGKMLKLRPQAKDPRSDAQKMTDATGPRKGSNFRGD